MKKKRRNGKKKLGLVRIVVGLLLAVALILGLKSGAEIVWKLAASLTVDKGEEIQSEAVPVSEEPATADHSPSERNAIYDRNFQEMAISFPTRSVYVRPLELADRQQAAARLADLLELDEQQLAATLASERSFVWLRRNLDLAKAEAIQELGLAGLYLEAEEVRYYPGKHLASHVIGFLEEEQGLAGIESFYDDLLSNDVSPAAVNLTAAGIDPLELDGGMGGSPILTLDLDIQKELEKRLTKLTRETGARAAMALIMEPSSGEILALANQPSFDANFFWKYTDEEWRNRVVSQPLRPAAFQKLFQMAAELEAGNTTFLDTASQEVAARIMTPRRLKVIKSDTLAKKAGQQWNQLWDGVWWSGTPLEVQPTLNRQQLSDFGQRYGLLGGNALDLPSDLGQPGEGSVGPDESSWCGTPTLLDLLSSFSRLLNSGKPMRPHLLKGVWLQKQERLLKSRSDQSLAMGSPELRMNFLDLLVQLSDRRPRQGIFVESLYQEVDEAEPQVLEVSDESAGEEGDQGALIPAESRFQALLLGGAPGLGPELTMAMVLDGVRLELEHQSPLRAMAQKTLIKALQLKTGGDDSQRPATDGYDQLYDEWSSQQESGQQLRNATGATKQIMPDVTGLSLRKALQVLQESNLRIQINGSGRVVSQSPAPGAVLGKDQSCLLQLQPEQ